MSFMALVLAILLSANCVFAQTPSVNMDKYITLTVSQGDTIHFKIQASADNTPAKIESGSWDTIITADSTNATFFYINESLSTTMTIYGDVKKFYCTNQGSKITALDASHNTALTYLDCGYNNLTSLNVSGLTNLNTLHCDANQLTSLDVSTLTNLEELYCYKNQLTSLNVSRLTNLKILRCFTNQLTSLNVSGLTNLKELRCDANQLTSLDVSTCTLLSLLTCYDNQLTSLDISACTLLRGLNCYNNQLTSLDVSGLTNLRTVYCSNNQLTSLNISGCDNLMLINCYGNQLSTQAIDNLYCQVPDRTTQEIEVAFIVSVSATDTIALATNKTNATYKNWNVFWQDTADYSTYEVVTNGTYVCGYEPVSLANAESKQITLYPNPAKEYVVLEGIKGERVTIFDANGKIIKQEVINERLDIRDLESGVYYLQVKDITTKLIKQ